MIRTYQGGLIWDGFAKYNIAFLWATTEIEITPEKRLTLLINLG